MLVNKVGPHKHFSLYIFCVEMDPLLWIFLIFVVSAFFLVRRRNGDKKSPPGPFPLPVLGSLLSMGKFPFKTYAKWAEKYGPIFQFNLGQVRIIAISDVGMLKEAFQRPVLSGRPQLEILRIFSDFKGITGSQGAPWEEQRKFTTRHLRDFGFGKNSMETLIMNEVETFLDWLEVGRPISLDRKFSIAVVNALWTIMTSEKLNYDDPKLIEVVNKTKMPEMGGVKFAINMFLPWVTKLVPSLARLDDLEALFDSNRKFIEVPIKAHRETYHENSEPRDFIDVYLNQINKAEEGSSFYGDEGGKNLNATIFDLFVAGSFPTSIALTWAVLYLIIHLDIQKKVQEEIDTVVGKSRKPSLTDRAKMPQTESLIFEILRHSSFVPSGAFHCAMSDTDFHGYSVPNGTLIMPNTHYIHHDPRIWGDPENFRPSRFLTPDGKSIDTDKTANMVIFSTGRRTCLGQPLAMTQLFLFMTGLLQKFNFRAVPGEKLGTTPNMNAFDTLEPQKFQVILTERES